MKKIIAVFVLVLGFASSVSATIIAPPPALPTSVGECKKGGWENFGGLFKDQGDCVSFVVTDGRNAPDGPLAN